METLTFVLRSINYTGDDESASFKIPFRHYFPENDKMYKLKSTFSSIDTSFVNEPVIEISIQGLPLYNRYDTNENTSNRLTLGYANQVLTGDMNYYYYTFNESIEHTIRATLNDDIKIEVRDLDTTELVNNMDNWTLTLQFEPC